MLYIGHTTLETFLREVTPEQPLYLNLLGELLPHKAGIDVLRCYLLLQTNLPNREQETSIVYWLMRIGEVLAPGGIPWERQHAAMRKVGLSAQAAIRNFLDAKPLPERLRKVWCWQCRANSNWWSGVRTTWFLTKLPARSGLRKLSLTAAGSKTTCTCQKDCWCIFAVKICPGDYVDAVAIVACEVFKPADSNPNNPTWRKSR